MKKIMSILVVIGILIASARLTQVMADGNGFADLPPELPVGNVSS